ncbi:MAG TPA: isoprenylcysteine carboxylmethyltransferase family protein [Steroidobacteraceae bacterium]|jgi:protein-S-isoprenylcysteine O-methyltransferase Ste14
MSLGEFYRYFFPIIWVLWMVVWVVLARNVKVTVRRQDAVPRLLNMALLLCAAVLLWTAHLPVAGLTVRVLPASQWRFWTAAGAALTLLGLLFAVWARVYLGRNWSGVAALKADHELVTGGPYRWVRHPIYSGLALAFVGTAMAIGSGGESWQWSWRWSQSRIGCGSRKASCGSSSALPMMPTPGACGRSCRIWPDPAAQ